MGGIAFGSFASNEVDEFRRRLQEYAGRRLRTEDLQPELKLDGTLDFRDISERNVSELLALAPFGHGNPLPVFAALDVEVAGPPAPWSDKHLRVMLRQNGRSLAFKAWNFAARAAELRAGARIDAAFSIEEDEFAKAQGNPGWVPALRDVRPAVKIASA